MSLVSRLHEALGAVPTVGPGEAKDLLDAGAVLLDVREPYEWAAGHAPQARHLPLGQLPTRVERLPADREVVVVCRSGNRSRHAAAMLLRSGRQARNLHGGMRAWAAAGLPVVGPGGRPGRVA